MLVPMVVVACGVFGAGLSSNASATNASAQTAPSAVRSPVTGGAGLGDPLFPNAGNSGYQVIHYDIKLRYAIRTHSIRATTTITAIANESLSSFHLDFHGLTIDSLSVNGVASARQRSGDELVVTPVRLLPRVERFTVVVHYHGVPRTYIDPDGSQDGWVSTSDGADAVGEPLGAMTWFPCNNHPKDKASYTIHVDVPLALVAASNGRLVSHRDIGTRGLWTWTEPEPMTTYLTTVAIGHFRHVTGTASGIPIRSFIDPNASPTTHTKDIQHALSFLSQTFGPYPFGDAGIIVDNTGVGYALETQTRPTFDGDTDVQTLVHEFSHQWFGDSVSLKSWQDIWLNEGFATYTEWLWKARTDPAAPRQNFDQECSRSASDPFWTQAPAAFTDPADLFASPVYERGAMTLQALRNKIGSADFFQLLRTWVRENTHGHGTTRQFRLLAEQISGQDLKHFFDVWLYQPVKPTSW
jgi:aminopeptidase N